MFPNEIPEQFRFRNAEKIEIEKLKSSVKNPGQFIPLKDYLAQNGIDQCDQTDPSSILDALVQLGIQNKNYIILMTPEFRIKECWILFFVYNV